MDILVFVSIAPSVGDLIYIPSRCEKGTDLDANRKELT